MLKKILPVVATFIVTTIAMTAAVTHLLDRPTFEKGVVPATIDSKILREKRELSIHLPESYERERDRRYPVVYVLDGSSQASHTSSSAKLMARIGAMQEVIVVAIPSSSENRARDYTPPYMFADAEKDDTAGGGERFLEFLEKELIPYVDRSFRTAPVRMLAGNSRGGLFVVYSLLARPELFQARFAHSPALWRDDSRIATELQRSLATRITTPTFLYLSLGDKENRKMTTAFKKSVAMIHNANISSLDFRADITKGADHSGNAELSTPVGFMEYTRATIARSHGSPSS